MPYDHVRARSRPARRARAGAVAIAAASIAAVVTVLLAGTAFAHAYVTTTSPLNGAQLATAPKEATLTFNEPVGHAHVAVEGPDGLRWDDGPPIVVGGQVTQRLHALGPAGRYEVNYRVVSVDGHPVQGSIDFTLTTPGPGATPPQPAAEQSTSSGTWQWLAIAVGALAVLVAAGWLATIRRRARARRSPR